MAVKNPGSALGQAIDAWAKRKSAVVNDLHKLLVRCICHSIEHGDVTYINKLDAAVSDGTDAKGKSVSGINLFSFRRYLEEKAPVTWQKAADGVAAHFAYSKAKNETLRPVFDANPTGFEESLSGTPFWHVVKAPDPFEGFDLTKYIKAGIAKAKKYIADPAKKDKVNIVGIERFERVALEVEKAKSAGNETVVAIATAKARKETADPIANAKAVQRRKVSKVKAVPAAA